MSLSALPRDSNTDLLEHNIVVLIKVESNVLTSFLVRSVSFLENFCRALLVRQTCRVEILPYLLLDVLVTLLRTAAFFLF